MAAYTDPTKPWFGIDFLTWKPPPRPVCECDGCGWRNDRWGVLLVVAFHTTAPMVVCPGCIGRKGHDLSTRFEVTMALRLGARS